MCNHCTQDPRDRILQAERALWGLRTVLAELPPGSGIPAEGLGTLVAIIHDRLDSAAEAIQDFVPRSFDPKNA